MHIYLSCDFAASQTMYFKTGFYSAPVLKETRNGLIQFTGKYLNRAD